jgi:hypothetical protein
MSRSGRTFSWRPSPRSDATRLNGDDLNRSVQRCHQDFTLINRGALKAKLTLSELQPIPDHRAYATKQISDRSSDQDEHNGSYGIERPNNINRLDHMRPEDEIENRLRPADQHKKCPHGVPAADQRGDR